MSFRRRRNQEGKVVKEYDHAMDAVRYLVMAGPDALRRSEIELENGYVYTYPGEMANSWIH